MSARGVLVKVMNFFETLSTDKQAVTAIEYALIAALIAVVIIVAVTNLGTTVSTEFNTVASNV